MYAEVLVEYNAKQIDRTFTYLVPSILQNKLKKGMQVKIPFGNKEINGFVLNITDQVTDIKGLKAIKEITNEEIILNEELLAIGEVLVNKTFCSRITAFETMLPSSLKVKTNNDYNKYEVFYELKASSKEIEQYFLNHKNSLRQKAIVAEITNQGRIAGQGLSPSSVKALIENNIIKQVKDQKYRLTNEAKINKDRYVLTADQKVALEQIDLTKHQVHLLYGVTGSGKTEVYLNLMEQVISEGKTAIMLVPEITLTVQTVSTLQKRFGDKVAIFHSGLSTGEKNDEYYKIIRGEVKIVIGTRSAIFVPLINIGLIVLDEEHSDTYKQENNPRYHALDIALFRAKYHQCPLILASATPSLEAMARAQKGVYNLITMKHRIGNATLPTCYLVDMLPEMKKRQMILSSLLKAKIKDRIQKQEQIILLLNRRGFATTISCQACGYTFKCPNCEITLTYHKTKNNFRCHYCGYTIFKPEVCPDCHEAALNYLGLGTEKLEGEIKHLFPEARVTRMDTDTTQNKNQHEKIVGAFANHESDILVGTQMISKGLDFPLVTLVGIINADSSLNQPDFRSSERTFQLLNQVAGRAGRKDLPGEVIIQTFNPDNFTLQCVQKHDYLAFYEYEIHNRQLLKYLPYYYLTSIKIASRDYETASKEATLVKKYLLNNLTHQEIILGPTTAAMFKTNNIYRLQIIIKYRSEEPLFKVLKELLKIYQSKRLVNLEIDNSPRVI